MTNNKLFGIKSAYILLLVLFVSALCLPAAVSADLGEPVIKYRVSSNDVVAGKSGTVTVTLTETGKQDYAQNIQITASTTTPGVSFGTGKISMLKPGASQSTSFPIYTSSTVKPGIYVGTLDIYYEDTGAMGIGTFPHYSKGTFQYTVTAPPVADTISRAVVVTANSASSFTVGFFVAFLILFVICVWAVHRSNKKRREDERREDERREWERREWERREWERRNNGRPEWDNRNMNSQEWWESNDRDRRQLR